MVSILERESLKHRVTVAVNQHLARYSRHLQEISADTDMLRDAMATMCGGGKRLRAAFCYWAWRAHGGSADGEEAKAIIDVCAALEFFQAAALFHDDVIDNSDTRRSLPTAHRAFTAHHLEHQWVGNSRDFGNACAILLGDLALILAAQIFADGIDTHQLSPRRRGARKLFNDMQTEVTAGQFLDVHGAVAPMSFTKADTDRARLVVVSKSARYSVEYPLTIGAHLAGLTELEPMRALGLPLGIAYQLRDDILGVFGDPEVTGKPAGDDLREGKRTVLVLEALRRANTSDRKVLAQALGNSLLTTSEVAQVQSIIVETGALAVIEDEISTLVDKALAHVPTSQPAGSVLAELALAATNRES